MFKSNYYDSSKVESYISEENLSKKERGEEIRGLNWFSRKIQKFKENLSKG